MPSAWPRLATSSPMPPRPATSSVLPVSDCGCEPAKLRFQPSPVACRPTDTCSERDSANISAMVCSAITGPATARMLVTVNPALSRAGLPRHASTPADMTAIQRTRFAAASTRSSQAMSSPPMMASAFAASLMRPAASATNTISTPGATPSSVARISCVPVPLGFCVAITMRWGARQPRMSRSADGLSASPCSRINATALGSAAGGSSLANVQTARKLDVANKAARLRNIFIPLLPSTLPKRRCMMPRVTEMTTFHFVIADQAYVRSDPFC